MNEENIKPFLKWPGGKRWLANQLVPHIKKYKRKYIEPFLGSGALFFALCPDSSIISDINGELIEVYIAMRDEPDELKKILLYHQKKHCSEYYYKVRSQNPRKTIYRAGRFLYLNRTCFNGMYRVNRHGKFNVPKGSKNDFIYDIDQFDRYSKVLKKTTIMQADFATVISMAHKGDFIFADPPYAMKNDESFTKYNEKLFTWDDQKRLFFLLQKAKDRGVHIVMTNAACSDIYSLYEDAGFNIYQISRMCSIAGNSEKRSKISEYVISTDIIEGWDSTNDKSCNI